MWSYQVSSVLDIFWVRRIDEDKDKDEEGDGENGEEDDGAEDEA